MESPKDMSDDLNGLKKNIMIQNFKTVLRE